MKKKVKNKEKCRYHLHYWKYNIYMGLNLTVTAWDRDYCCSRFIDKGTRCTELDLFKVSWMAIAKLGFEPHQPSPLASLMVQTVKNLPAMRETRVWSLGKENPLEKGMATHSSILAWEIPRTEEPGGLQSMGLQRVGHNWVTNTFFFLWPIHHITFF